MFHCDLKKSLFVKLKKRSVIGGLMQQTEHHLTNPSFVTTLDRGVDAQFRSQLVYSL